MEAIFTHEIRYPLQATHNAAAGPSAEIMAGFVRPPPREAHLVPSYAAAHVGSSSCGVEMTARRGDEFRFETDPTMVQASTDGRPAPRPDMIRARLVIPSQMFKTHLTLI